MTMTPPFNTYRDIRRRLDELQETPEQNTIEETLKLSKEALRLSGAMSETWVYDGEDAEDYTLDAMEKAGSANGKHVPSRPASSQTDFTILEGRLVDSFRIWCSDVYDTFKQFGRIMTSQLHRLRSIIKEMEDAQKRGALKPNENFYKDEIEDRLTAEIPVGRIKNQLNSPLEKFLERRNLFMAFREAHGLHRNPKYEESALAFAFIAIICIVFETAINGFMYGQASDLGLIGGWGVAAGLSIVIFGSSFLAGWVLTSKNGLVKVKDSTSEDYSKGWRRSLWPQLVGWSGWVTLTTVILILIGFVCVYRDEAATLDPGSGNHPMSETISRLTTFDLLPQADIEGLLLIFVNLAIMLIGMYKGYTHFDKVPHYKSYAKDLAADRKDFKSVIEKVKKELGLSDQALAVAGKLPVYSYQDVANIVNIYSEGVAVLKQLQDACEYQISKTAEDCNDRLSAYRNANKAARPKTSPPPAYFGQSWWEPPPPSERPLPREAPSIGEVDIGAIVDALENHRSAALDMLAKKAEERYSIISEYESESDKHCYEVNRGNAEGDD